MATTRKKRVHDLAVLHPDAAGIDVGASQIFVAVPEDRDAESVRSFATFTRDLHSLADCCKLAVFGRWRWSRPVCTGYLCIRS